MPFNIDSLRTHSRQEFCLALKAARERNGITLADIAAATKIPASLFAALERNDLRRWPKGLFRRSFFKDYVGMIGVPVADACAEFVRLFPDDEGAVLDAEWHGPRASILSRLRAALIDVVTVLPIGPAPPPRLRVRIKVRNDSGAVD